MKSLGVRREKNSETTFAAGPYPLDDPEVLRLAASIREHGLLQPYGRTTEGVGIWGRRRWTAVTYILEMKEALAHTVEVEAGEEEILRDVENAHRTDLPAMEREIALARIANRMQVADAVTSPAVAPKGGRGKKGAAAKAAEAVGVDTRTVQQAVADVVALSKPEQKALSKANATHAQIRDAVKLEGPAREAFIEGLSKAAKKAAAKEKASEDTRPRDECGHVLPPEVETLFRPSLKTCDALLAQLSKALTEAEKVEEVWKKHTQPLMQTLNGRWAKLLANIPNVASSAQRVASHVVPNLVDAIDKVKRARPHALCPKCKGRPPAMVASGTIQGHKFGGMADCPFCGGFGFVDEARYAKVHELFRVYEPVVGEGGETLHPVVMVANHSVLVTALAEVDS